MREGDQIKTQRGAAIVLSVAEDKIWAKVIETGEEFGIVFPSDAHRNSRSPTKTRNALPNGTKSLRVRKKPPTVASMSFDQIKDLFLRKCPGGFSDPVYLKSERDYKVEAHEFFVERLGRGQFRELLAKDSATLVKEVQHCIGLVNLLHPIESARFRDAMHVNETALPFFARLADLLEAGDITEEVFAPYAKAVCDLPDAQGRPAASWPIATVVPFLAQPERHMFLKPSKTKSAAAVIGFQLNYRPKPNWLTYKCLSEMTEIYRRELADLQPRDLIDVQSFIWVAFGGWGVH